ncbi:protein shisa-like-1a [Liasis olivaceus]
MLLWLLLLPPPVLLQPGTASFQPRLAASRGLLRAERRPSRALPLAAQNAHLCEGYSGADGRLHAGFFCPRLSDAPADAYCCQPGGSGALKSCCPRPDADRPLSGNASTALPAGLRSPLLPLLAVGLYGGLLLALAAADLLHFCRRRGAAGRGAVTCPAQGPPPEERPVASA